MVRTARASEGATAAADQVALRNWLTIGAVGFLDPVADTKKKQ